MALASRFGDLLLPFDVSLTAKSTNGAAAAAENAPKTGKRANGCRNEHQEQEEKKKRVQ